MSKPLQIHNFEAMLDMLETKPLQAALLAKRNSVTLTRLKYETSAIAYGVALKLRDDDDLLDSFYELEFWLNRIYKRNPEKLLAHVHMYVYGSNQGGEAKRARNHAAALAPYFDSDQPIEPADLPDFLDNNGGFTGLVEMNTPDDRSVDEEKPTTAQAGEVGGDDDEQNVIESYEDRLVGAKPKTVAAPVVGDGVDGAAKESASKKAATRRQDDLKGLKRDEIADHLLLEWTSEQREKLMDVEVGTTVMANITRLHDNKDGFAVFELTEIDL